MKKLVIIGASGHGKVVADIAIKMNKWEDIVFLDDDETIRTSMGLEVAGKTSDSVKFKNGAEFFVAIGDNITREKVQEKLLNEGFLLTTLIHPSAIIGSDVDINLGTVVMAGVVINSATRVGKGCIINTNSSVDHDNTLSDYVHVSPGVTLSGTVHIGERSWLGAGCSVTNNVKICKSCKVGVGTVVLNDITQPGTYVGIPARLLKQ